MILAPDLRAALASIWQRHAAKPLTFPPGATEAFIRQETAAHRKPHIMTYTRRRSLSHFLDLDAATEIILAASKGCHRTTWCDAMGWHGALVDVPNTVGALLFFSQDDMAGFTSEMRARHDVAAVAERIITATAETTTLREPVHEHV